MLTLVGAIACKVSHNLSSCYPPRARKLLVSLFFMTLVHGQHIIRQSSEIMSALRTVETSVVYTQRHRLDADKFPMFSVFCRDSDPC